MTTTLEPLKFLELGEMDGSFSEALQKQSIASTTEDLTGLVPHAALDGAQKVTYHSPKTDRTIYALELVTFIPTDGFFSRVWQFDRDFSIGEVTEFLRSQQRVSQ